LREAKPRDTLMHGVQFLKYQSAGESRPHAMLDVTGDFPEIGRYP
jgi:hypothetical protein